MRIFRALMILCMVGDLQAQECGKSPSDTVFRNELKKQNTALIKLQAETDELKKVILKLQADVDDLKMIDRGDDK